LSLQGILGGILLIHRPQVLLKLINNTKLPGESDAAAVVRWREVAVSNQGPYAKLLASQLGLLPMQRGLGLANV
jgi:hypothetical protein